MEAKSECEGIIRYKARQQLKTNYKGLKAHLMILGTRLFNCFPNYDGK